VVETCNFCATLLQAAADSKKKLLRSVDSEEWLRSSSSQSKGGGDDIGDEITLSTKALTSSACGVKVEIELTPSACRVKMEPGIEKQGADMTF